MQNCAQMKESKCAEDILKCSNESATSVSAHCLLNGVFSYRMSTSYSQSIQYFDLLLVWIHHFHERSVDPDQLASSEAS